MNRKKYKLTAFSFFVLILDIIRSDASILNYSLHRVIEAKNLGKIMTF